MNRAEYYDQHESKEEMAMDPMPDEPETNENPELCAECAGKCCKRSPGIYLPDDFGPASIMKEKIKTCVRDGKMTFDYWEGDFEGHESPKYVRASTKDSIGKIVNASWGGECAFLQADGCELSFGDRPAECRDLVPVAGNGDNCHMDELNKRALIWAWIPLQGMIAEIIAELEGEAKHEKQN